MLAIDVELLHGTIRAGSADDLAITGDGDPGEWPLSPSRLLSAFVAADGTGDRQRATAGIELRLLETAAPPVIRCDRELGRDEDPAAARTGVLRSPQLERFVVVDATAKGRSVQEYPARQAQAVRRSSVIAPFTAHVTYLWPEVEPTPDDVAGLRARAARIGYLGCADSPVRLRVSTDYPDRSDDPRPTWIPDLDGDAFVETPYPGMLDDLDRQFAAFTSGQWVRRSWIPSHRTAYRRPGRTMVEPATPFPEVLWLALDRSVDGRHIVRLTEALRAAVMARLQEVLGEGTALPHEITGHGAPTPSWDQVLFLALPNVGHRYSDGRIHGAAVAIPDSCENRVVEAIRAAVAGVVQLRWSGGRALGLSPAAPGRGVQSADPRRWSRPSVSFVTAFPLVHDRFSKKGPTLDDVARWCDQVHLPAPVHAVVDRLPLAPGAASLRASEATRRGRHARPFSHLRVQLSAPVSGPVALGHLRSFGLGLLVPEDAMMGGATDG